MGTASRQSTLNTKFHIINKIEHDVAPTRIFMVAISCHGTDNDELLFSDDTKQKASRSVDE